MDSYFDKSKQNSEKTALSSKKRKGSSSDIAAGKLSEGILKKQKANPEVKDSKKVKDKVRFNESLNKVYQFHGEEYSFSDHAEYCKQLLDDMSASFEKFDSNLNKIKNKEINAFATIEDFKKMEECMPHFDRIKNKNQEDISIIRTNYEIAIEKYNNLQQEKSEAGNLDEGSSQKFGAEETAPSADAGTKEPSSSDRPHSQAQAEPEKVLDEQIKELKDRLEILNRLNLCIERCMDQESDHKPS